MKLRRSLDEYDTNSLGENRELCTSGGRGQANRDTAIP